MNIFGKIFEWIRNFYIEFRRTIGWARNRDIWIVPLDFSSIKLEPTPKQLMDVGIALNLDIPFTHEIPYSPCAIIGTFGFHDPCTNIPHVSDVQINDTSYRVIPFPNDMIELTRQSSLDTVAFYKENCNDVPTRCTVHIIDDVSSALIDYQSFMAIITRNLSDNNQFGVSNGNCFCTQ